MRRVACVLTVLGILCVAVGEAQAHNPYFHNQYHHAYHGSVVVHPRVYVAPRVVVPVAPVPTVVYPQPLYYSPMYGCGYPYYAPVPAAGFYYRSRGLSLGIGW
ncbi:MAG: hypothetical protein WCB27_17400 [Thermoguttaceae bacterium]